MKDSFLIRGEGGAFYRLSNAQGKEWLMPVRDMRTAMCLYQPSGRKGKLLKSLFPLVHRIPLVRRIAGARSECCRLSDSLNGLLSRLFGETEFGFSVFYGTPCVHQKITVQISRGDRILGYLKLSDSGRIADLFQHEAGILAELRRSGMENIPECLYCGKLDDGVHIFVQSTVKSLRSRTMHDWLPAHEKFLDELYRRTRSTVPFESSDYCRTLSEFRERAEELSGVPGIFEAADAIDGIISAMKGKEVDFCACHGDFTPWNMFSENGNLFVFDWEYSRLSCPPVLDRYHFFTQTAIFGRGMTAREITDYLQTADAGWIDRDSYMMYIVDVIARFVLRDGDSLREDTAAQVRIWAEILKFLRK